MVLTAAPQIQTVKQVNECDDVLNCFGDDIGVLGSPLRLPLPNDGSLGQRGDWVLGFRLGVELGGTDQRPPMVYQSNGLITRRKLPDLVLSRCCLSKRRQRFKTS